MEQSHKTTMNKEVERVSVNDMYLTLLPSSLLALPGSANVKWHFYKPIYKPSFIY